MSEIEADLQKAHELISEDLVKEALEKDKGQDAKLISFQLKPFTQKGDNLASIVVSVEISYKKKGSDYEESYVAKMNPCQPVNSLTEVIEAMFSIETDVLMIIIEGMNEQLDKLNLPQIRTPKLYAQTLEIGREAHITENLRKGGFKMIDEKIGLDLDYCVLVLKELGRFHASSLLYEKTLHPKTIQESFDFKDPRYFDHHESFIFFDKVMITFGNVFIDILKKEGSKYEICVKWLLDHREKLAKYFHDGFTPSKSFDVLVHGDCRSNNFLFRYDENDKPIDVRFVDLQCSRKASPATDLNYLFYGSLSGDFRVEKMNYMISIYYKSFCEVLSRADKSPPFSYQELILEVKNRRIFGLSVAVMFLNLIFSKDRGPLFNRNLSDDSSEILGDSENLFREKIISLFDEFIEYGLLK